MAEQTGISWADATFNAWMGCEKVSPACAHCYAETITTNRMGLHVWGASAPRQIKVDSGWRLPLRWARLAGKGLLPDGTENKDGHRPRVFTNSLADVFEERPDLEEPRHRLFELIRVTPELDWLVLTKRPEFAYEWLRKYDSAHGFIGGESLLDPSPDLDRDGLGWGVLPNVWLGVSIENAAFTCRADVLRDIPAAVRFLSCEPLLGSLFPKNATGSASRQGDCLPLAPEGRSPSGRSRAPLDLSGIDWVIVGGESGPKKTARPMHPSWVREIRDAVQLAPQGLSALNEAYLAGAPDDVLSEGIADELSGRDRPALHFKQWGSWTPDPYGRDPEAVWLSPDGRRNSSFAADAFGLDLTGAVRMRYAGASPGSGGKFLDGTDWCEFPAPTGLIPA